VVDLDAWQEVWATLRSNKLRAFLTALGVFWGVFMLILMLGIGNGLERGVIHNLNGLTNYSVYLWSQRTSMPYRGLQPGRFVKLNNADISAIARTEGVEHVAPRIQMGTWRAGENARRCAKPLSATRIRSANTSRCAACTSKSWACSTHRRPAMTAKK
jgi:putative ABC transport system permease protein